MRWKNRGSGLANQLLKNQSWTQLRANTAKFTSDLSNRFYGRDKLHLKLNEYSSFFTLVSHRAHKKPSIVMMLWTELSQTQTIATSKYSTKVYLHNYHTRIFIYRGILKAWFTQDRGRIRVSHLHSVPSQPLQIQFQSFLGFSLRQRI